MSSDSSEMDGTDQLKENLLKPGFALKSGSAKRTVFSLQQKEVMIEFYNRQANCGIRADPVECISAMKEYWKVAHSMQTMGNYMKCAVQVSFYPVCK